MFRHRFDPDQTRAMQMAYECAWNAVAVRYEEDPAAGARAREMLAEIILNRASTGERNPDILCDEALRRLPPVASACSLSGGFAGSEALRRKSQSLNRHMTGHKYIESDRMLERLVFDHDGKPLGNVKRLLIERRSGRVMQVVVQTLGRFGCGRIDLKLPWEALSYEPTLQGYRLARGVVGTAASG